MEVNEAARGSERAGLDGLARGLADGSVSRRRALKLGAAGIVAGVAGSLGIGAEASARRRSKSCRRCTGETSCLPSDCGVPTPGFDGCVCVKSASGKKCCAAAPSCEEKKCTKNSDCGGKEICSKEYAKFCCGREDGKGVCMRRCRAPH